MDARLERLRLIYCCTLLAGTVAACASETEFAPGYNFGSSTSGTGAHGDGDSGGALGGSGHTDSGGTGSGDGDGDDPFENFGGAATGPDPPDDGPPACAEDIMWGLPQNLTELNTPGNEHLLAISGDEKSLVFMRDNIPFISERPSPVQPWGEGVEISLPEGVDTSLGLTLTADSLGLIVVLDGGSGFARMDRHEIGTPFGLDLNVSPFYVVNLVTQITSTTLSHPVMSSSSQLWWVEHWADTSIYFSQYDPEKTISRNQVGCTMRGACDLLLDGVAGFDKLITSVSSDHRTVIIMDELEGPRMLWRASVSEGHGFLTSISLGDRLAPHVNGSCSRLYYSRNGDLYFDSPIPN